MTIDPKRTVNVAVQVLPLDEDVYRIVGRAIKVITKSGVKYEVGPMETVMEGDLDTLLEVAKQAHLACFEAGAEKVVTLIKIGDSTSGTSIDEKIAKYRDR
ncbi:MAG: MTH1187 family thiamine-binding protein [Anaerolineales bacterium]